MNPTSLIFRSETLELDESTERLELEEHSPSIVIKTFAACFLALSTFGDLQSGEWPPVLHAWTGELGKELLAKWIFLELENTVPDYGMQPNLNWILDGSRTGIWLLSPSLTYSYDGT